MIEIVGVSRNFGPRRAVQDVSVTFPAGAVTCLLGLNGAGKTTLLRLIAGLDTPDRGAVLVLGKRPRDQADPMRTLGMHLGAMDPHHTARRHLAWLAALAGIAAERVDTVLTDVGLSDRATERIIGLSTGARQRLSIAAMMLGDPQVYLFDEPLNGLDVPGIVWLRGLLRRPETAGLW